MTDHEKRQRWYRLLSERDKALSAHGSQSIEYRRANRRVHRAHQRRIDYLPDGESVEILEAALREGYALSLGDAINQALRTWRDTFPE